MARRTLTGQRSPVRLQRDRSPAGLLTERITGDPHYAWVCDEDRLQGARFVERKDSSRFVVLHRSTRPGALPWQVSFFDDRGAVGDSEAKSCERALRDHIPRRVYRLREIELRRGRR